MCNLFENFEVFSCEHWIKCYYADAFLYIDALNSSTSVSLLSLSVSSIRSFSKPALGGKNSEKLFVSFLLQQPE